MFEIERRFLATATVEEIKARMLEEYPAQKFYEPRLIVQSYLSKTGSAIIRAREITKGTGEVGHFLTMKWRQNDRRSIEIEHPIPVDAFDKYVSVSFHEPIRKLRHRGLFGEFTLDRFLNPKLNGLLLAEIELPHEDADFERPWWLGEEVTGRLEYTNFGLARTLAYQPEETQHDHR